MYTCVNSKYLVFYRVRNGCFRAYTHYTVGIIDLEGVLTAYLTDYTHYTVGIIDLLPLLDKISKYLKKNAYLFSSR